MRWLCTGAHCRVSAWQLYIALDPARIEASSANDCSTHVAYTLFYIFVSILDLSPAGGAPGTLED